MKSIFFLMLTLFSITIFAEPQQLSHEEVTTMMERENQYNSSHERSKRSALRRGQAENIEAIGLIILLLIPSFYAFYRKKNHHLALNRLLIWLPHILISVPTYLMIHSRGEPGRAKHPFLAQLLNTLSIQDIFSILIATVPVILTIYYVVLVRSKRNIRLANIAWSVGPFIILYGGLCVFALALSSLH